MCDRYIHTSFFIWKKIKSLNLDHIACDLQVPLKVLAFVVLMLVDTFTLRSMSLIYNITVESHSKKKKNYDV